MNRQARGTLHETCTRLATLLLTLVLLECLGELVDGGGHLQSLHQNSLLSLDADVLWPFDEAGEVTLGLDVSAKSEILHILLEQRA